MPLAIRNISYPAFLSIDTGSREMSQPWIGLVVTDKNDSLKISRVEWNSPAWKAGIRSGSIIRSINGQAMTAKQYSAFVSEVKPGDQMDFRFYPHAGPEKVIIFPVVKKERSFEIRPIANPDPLQSAILKGWLG